jgi:hypothetical protein
VNYEEKEKEKAGARPNGEREKGRSRTPVMAMFVTHIDSDVKRYSGFASTCAVPLHICMQTR